MLRCIHLPWHHHPSYPLFQLSGAPLNCIPLLALPDTYSHFHSHHFPPFFLLPAHRPSLTFAPSISPSRFPLPLTHTHSPSRHACSDPATPPTNMPNHLLSAGLTQTPPTACR
ncbi:hypothetical protein EI94DRAFT_1714165 [Lactarius quietus]|nr:hypothetical protein EI94DRAFT_1714165 [Lactarius quietus]